MDLTQNKSAICVKKTCLKNLYNEYRNNYTPIDIIGEIWVKIKNMDGSYFISNYFRVKYYKNGKPYIFKQKINKDGYYEIRVTQNGVRKGKRIHRIWAECFLDNPNGYNVINHINGIKTDNFPSNIEWCTSQQNTEHAKNKGLIPFGTNVKHSRLPEKDVLDIYNSKETYAVLMAKYNLSKRMLYKIRHGLSWVSLTGGTVKNNSNKYSDDKVIAIYKDILTVPEISKKYNIPRSVVYRIKKKQTYKNVLDGFD